MIQMRAQVLPARLGGCAKMAGWQMDDYSKSDGKTVQLHHARLNVTQVHTLRRNPAQFWNLPALEGAAQMKLGGHFQLLASVLSDPAGPESPNRSSDTFDAAVIAIEGKSPDAQLESAIDFGHGGAWLLSPVVVQKLSVQLRQISEQGLRRRVEEALSIGADSNPLTYGPLLQSMLSVFSVLRRFYVAAAAFGQYVLVVRA